METSISPLKTPRKRDAAEEEEEEEEKATARESETSADAIPALSSATAPRAAVRKRRRKIRRRRFTTETTATRTTATIGGGESTNRKSRRKRKRTRDRIHRIWLLSMTIECYNSRPSKSLELLNFKFDSLDLPYLIVDILQTASNLLNPALGRSPPRQDEEQEQSCEPVREPRGAADLGIWTLARRQPNGGGIL
jgi:hypothetical protein